MKCLCCAALFLAVHMTKEDEKRLEQFRSIYQETVSSSETIPHTIHVVWMGPRNLTELQKEHILGWIRKYPDWRVVFWTDRERKTFHPSISIRKIDSSRYDTSNFLEKEHLFSYEILSSEGGVYVHPDVSDLPSLEDLHKRCSFYAFLAPPQEIGYSSSIFLDHHVIGAKKAHPVLQRTIQKVQEEWNRVENAFAYSGQETASYRLLYRTWKSLEDAVLEVRTPDMAVISSDSKNPPKIDLYKGSASLEEKIEAPLQKIEGKKNKLLLLLGAFSLLLPLLSLIKKVFRISPL